MSTSTRRAYDIDLDDLPKSIRPLPRNLIANGRRLLQSLVGAIPPRLYPQLIELVSDRTKDQLRSEAEIWASVIGCPWQQIMIANCNYDLSMAKPFFGSLLCSVIALPTPSGPVVGRNLDWWPVNELVQASCVLRYRKQDKFSFAVAGWPGSIGAVTGVSAGGFAVSINQANSGEPLNPEGHPILLFLRYVLENAPNFQSAQRMLVERPLTAPALFTLVGSNNDEFVVIERTPNQAATRGAESGRLVTTNHYRVLNEPEADDPVGNTCDRYDRLAGTAFPGHVPDREISTEKMLETLATPPVKNDSTVQHVILKPGQGELALAVPTDLLRSRQPGL